MKKTLLRLLIVLAILSQSWNSISQERPISAVAKGWPIQNIQNPRDCPAPQNLQAQGGLEYWNYIVLTWDPMTVVDTWLHWDDGVNYTSIGTLGAIEFDAAARWTPDQLTGFEGASLTKVAFYPAPPPATAQFSIRVWTGELAANLIVDQPVINPELGEWNIIDLDTPVPIDIMQELWVGYHVNSTWGYPAGTDDGPAIDGYGNMMKYGTWKTLLQFNPELDYNWNIQALVTGSGTDTLPLFKVYRSDDGAPYFQRGIADQNYYFDDSVCGGVLMHDYKVTAIYIDNNDTCESDYSNVATEICEGIHEDKKDLQLNIYPNPVHDFLTIESSEKIDFITLYNYDGRRIFRKEIDDRNYILPVMDFPEGVYLLRIETGKGMVARKVVVMR